MPHVTQIVSETTDCNFGDALRSTRCEVVAIDTSLADWPILRDGVTASAEVVLIDGGGNGLAQLAKALDGRTGIDAIHLLSHGFAGGIQIGSERLDVTALVAQASSLIAIGESLSENAEILLYGCWTASGDGQSFLRVLAEITGAGVAASHDVIGAASLGGNWILDCRASGTVPRAILTSATMNAYQHTLAAPTVTLTNDNPGYLSGAGSGGLDLFSLVTAATNDGGQTFTGATFQVYGVTSNTEFLSIAGTDVQLTDGMSGPLTSGGYVVTVASGVATVTLSGMTLSDGQMSALIDGMSYKNTGGGGSSPGVTEARSVILRTVTDSGLPGDNATAVNQASTVTIDDGSTVNFVGTSTPASNVVAVASGSTTTVHFSIVQPAPLTLIGSMIQFNVVAPPGWIISSQALDGGPPSLSGFLLPGTHDFSFDITSTGTDTNGVFPITVLSLATGLDLSNAFNSSTILAVFPPTLTAIGGTPTIPQHSTSAVSLFSSVTANDSGGTFVGAVITVSGVADSAEYLTIGGIDVALTNGNSVALPGLGISGGDAGVSVAISGGIATLTISGLSLSESAMDGLVNGMNYRDSSSNTLSGSRTISITSVTDINNLTANLSGVSASVTVLDTTPPAAPVITSAALSDDATPVIAGTAEAGSTVTLTVAGATYTIVAIGGAWSINLGSAIPVSGALGLNANGNNGISAFATDPAGNISTLAVQTLTLDTLPPTAPVITSAALSDDATPVVAGTAEAGSTVTLTVAGAIYTAIAVGGAWSINLGSAIPASGALALNANGANGISAFATDPAGNISTLVVQTLTLDTLAPTAPVITSAALSDDATPVIAGTAEAGSIITVIVAGATYTTVATGGSWSIDLGSAIPASGALALNANGANGISASATDPAGNISTLAVQTLTLDTTSPAAPVLPSAALSDDVTPVIAGTAEAGSTVTLTVAGATYTIVAIGGAWSIDLGSAIPVSGVLALNANGANGISAFATDPAGNISTLAVQTLTLDTTPPAAPVITSAALTDDAAPVVAGTAEAGSTVTLTVAGAIYTTIAIGGAWSVDLGSAIPASGALALNANGVNGVSAFATDPAGNISTLAVQTLILDTTSPTAPVITSTALSDDAAPVVAGTAEAGSTVTLTVAGAVYTTIAIGGGWSVDLGSAVPASGALALNANGNNGISAFVTDPAGNISPSAAQTLTLDTTPPTAPVITSAALSDDVAPVVAGTAEPGSIVTLTVAGATYTTIAIGGAWSVDLGTAVPVSGVLTLDANGDNGISASATDPAGNVSTLAVQTLTLDTTSPTAPVITSAALSDDAAPVVAGTAEPGSTVTLTVAGATYTTVAIGGAWSVDLGSSVPVSGALSLDANGDNSVLAIASDPAGNVSTPTTQTLSLDTTAPVVTDLAASGSGITAGSGDLTIGAVIVLTLTLSEAVTVDTGNGTPTLTLNDGGVATYAAGSGTNTLAFTYTVGAGQTASDLAVTAFNLNLATVQDGAGNDADASGAIGNPPGILQIDTTVPTVIGLEASGSGVIAGAGDLTIGAAVVLTLTLSEAVTIAGSGTPTLTLNDGGVATYASGSGTNTLTFTYTVEGGQTASDLAVTAFNLNSSTVQDGRGNDADTSGAIVSPTGTLQIDTTAPSVTGVTVAGTSITAGDGDLTTGAMVAVTLIMSEAVAVAGGTPTLTLNDGGVATYASGSGTNTLTFTYTVGSGQTASDLAVTAFNLNSATVQDGASNNADTAGAIVNPPGTLQIDTTAPIVTAALVDNPRNAGGIVYSQILSGGGDPNTTVTISEGGQTVGTAQADGTGAWSFDPSSLSPSTHTLVASETDAAGNIGSTGEEPVTVPDARFDLTNEANTVSGSLVGSDYTGPVSYLQAQYIYTGSDNVILGARVPNVFIHGGSGDDALAVSAGSNVLDGGGGSNWLVGASGADGGNDTFFVDGRSGQPTWDTLVNFHPGDFLTFWGYNSTSGSIGWADNQGAPGYQGATLVANLGNGSAGPSLVTFAGLSVGSAQFATITGSSGGTDFLLVARLA